MNESADFMIFVQSVKGASASVLLALAFSRRAMTHQELQLWTKCGHDQITFALRSLAQAGWVSARTSRGPWALAPVHQVPVTADPGDDSRRRPSDGPGALGALPATSALKALNSDDVLDGENHLSTEEALTTSARRQELIESLLQAGIQEPTASELAELPHVTPEYVIAHAEHARAEGLRVGAAIQRMRLAAPMPDPRAPRTDEAAEKIRRFLEGPR